MRFRTVAIAAVVLVLAGAAGLAAYQISADARGEAAQQVVDREDSLAVEPDLRQTLAPDQDHDPTRYGDSVAVVYNGTEWDPDGNYTYYAESGEIEFLRDEPGEATIGYRYAVPADQVADAQLQTLTVGGVNIFLLAIPAALVVLLLFVGGFAARRLGVGSSGTRTRGR